MDLRVEVKKLWLGKRTSEISNLEKKKIEREKRRKRRNNRKLRQTNEY